MSQQNSPKFDPNQPYETVDSAPKFNPDAPFEVIGETVKKKEEPVSFGGGESVASPSVVTEDKQPLTYMQQQLRDKGLVVDEKKKTPLELDSDKYKTEVLSSIKDPKEKQAIGSAIDEVDRHFANLGGKTPFQKISELNRRMKEMDSTLNPEAISRMNEKEMMAFQQQYTDKARAVANEIGLNVDQEGNISVPENEKQMYQQKLADYIDVEKSKQKEDIGFFDNLKNKLASGVETAGADIIDMLGMATGLNYFKSYKDIAEGKRANAAQFSQQAGKYDNTIEEYLKAGEVDKAAGLAVSSAVESIPAMIPMFMNPEYGLYVMSGTSAVNKYRDIENTNVPEWKKVYNAVLSGAAEFAGEKLVTIPILTKSKQAILSLGKEQGRQAIEGAVKQAFEKETSKIALPSFVTEGLSEVATGLSQDLTDKVTTNPNIQIGANAIDNFTVGAVMGKVFSLPQDISKIVDKKQARDFATKVLDKLPADMDIESKINLGWKIVERDKLQEAEDKLDPKFKGKYATQLVTLNSEIDKAANEYLGKAKVEEVPTLSVGKMEEQGTEQQKLDYLKSKDVKVPDGTTMEQLNVLYDETKAKEEKQTAATKTGTKVVGEQIVEQQKKEDLVSDIEKRRQDELNSISVTIDNENKGVSISDTGTSGISKAIDDINAKYDAELKSLETTTKKQEPVVVEETKQVEIKPTEPISTAVEEVIPKEAPIVPTETKVAEKQQKEVVVEPKSRQQLIDERIDEIARIKKEAEGTREWRTDRYQKLVGKFGEMEAIQKLNDEIKAKADLEISKLPEIAPSKAEEIDKKASADFSKMVAELGFKDNNMSWGSTPMDEEMGVVLRNETKDASVFIKPHEDEYYDEENDTSDEITDGVTIELLTTKPQERGKGKAEKLLNKVIEWADKNGTDLFLSIAPQDKSTTESGLRRLYERNGFVFDGIHGKRVAQKQKQPIVGEQIEVKQVKKEEDEKGNKSGGEKTSQGRKEKLLEKNKKADDLLAEGLSDIADLLGTKLSLTGEQRVKVKDAVRKVAKGMILKGEVKAEQLVIAIKDYFSKAGHDISDDLINEALKEEQDAKAVREQDKGDVGTQKVVVEGTEGKLSVGNDGKDQKTPRGKDEGLKAKTQKLSTTGKDVVKVGRFETRLTLDDTKLPQSVKDQIKERGVGEFISMTDEQSYAIARQIAESTPIEEITQMSLSQDAHPMVRVGLMLEANKIFNKEVMLAEKEGRIADAQKWSDQQIDYYEEYAQINSRNAALLLRGLGTAAAFETFAPFTHVVKYKRDTAAERQKLQSTDTHEKSVKKVQKAAKTAYNDAVEGAINDPKVQKIIKENEGKPTTPINPDRLVELKKKEKSLIEKLKKSFGGTLTSGGLTKEGIEALGELAVVYIEEAGYHVGNAVKKLIKTAKAVGFTLTQEEALKYMPKEIDGKPIKEKQAEEETQKAAEKLATKIFGEVVVTKPKQDPLLQMVNTLLGKFKERDLGKERKKPTTDLEKIADAIQNKEIYSEVWTEARDMAVAKVEENELLDDVQKEEAIARIEDAYKKATSFTFTEAQVDRAIKRKMAELNVRVSDIVKEFYDIQSAERGKLSDALIEEAGLSKEQAKVLAEAIERRFDTILSEGKKKIVEKYIGKIKDGNTDAEKAQSKQRKTKTAELLELINVGAFESPEFREAYATAVGIPDFNQANANIIRKLGEEIQRQKEPLQKHKKIQDLLGFIKLLGGISPSDMALSIWYANTLSGIKTQERNTVGGTSGVTLRLLSDALVSGRPMATARGYINGIASGWTKAMDAWKEGYAPFSSRVEIPSTAEVYQMKRGLFKPIWNSIKYVGRTMNALDLLNAETGKEAFATVLANEALKVNRWKALVSPSYAKEQRELVKKYLITDKETVARLRKEIEDDAVEFGYTELDKRMILLDKINRMRPTETTEQAARFGVYSTGNVESFGTVGFLSDKIGDALKGIKLTYSEPKTGKQKTIAPLSLFAAFTKIAGNVGEMSLNYVPSVGMYRVYRGAYGSGFRMDAAKGATPNSKYAVELTPREKQTIIGQQILGTVAMVGLYLLTQPDDEDKSTIRITANGTGDFRANKNLTDWQEYSIGVTTEDGKTTWISYKNTPLILPFSVLGFMRDSKKYKKEFKEVDDLDLFTKGIQGMPSFLGDMSAIGSMTKVFDNLINVGSGKSTQSIPDNLLNTVKNFYTPALYRDVVDLTEQMWDVNVEAKIKGTSFFDLEAKKQQMFGRNPISVIKKIINKNEVVEAIDVYGRPTERLMPLDIIIKRDSDPTESDKLALYHQRYANVPVEPNVSQTLFEAFDSKSQEYVKILLDQGDKRQQQLWHNFVKRRGELILQAISDNMDLQGEEYRDAIEPAIRDASQQARLEIEEELTVNPLKDIEERQLKKQ